MWRAQSVRERRALLRKCRVRTTVGDATYDRFQQERIPGIMGTSGEHCHASDRSRRAPARSCVFIFVFACEREHRERGCVRVLECECECGVRMRRCREKVWARGRCLRERVRERRMERKEKDVSAHVSTENINTLPTIQVEPSGNDDDDDVVSGTPPRDVSPVRASAHTSKRTRSEGATTEGDASSDEHEVRRREIREEKLRKQLQINVQPGSKFAPVHASKPRSSARSRSRSLPRAHSAPPTATAPRSQAAGNATVQPLVVHSDEESEASDEDEPMVSPANVGERKTTAEATRAPASDYPYTKLPEPSRKSASLKKVPGFPEVWWHDEPVELNLLENFFAQSQEDDELTWRWRYRAGGTTSELETEMELAAFHLYSFCMALPAAVDAKKFCWLPTEKRSRTLGAATCFAHAPMCVGVLLQLAPGAVHKLQWSEVDLGLAHFNTRACCKDLWVPDFTLDFFRSSRIFWAMHVVHSAKHPVAVRCEAHMAALSVRVAGVNVLEQILKHGFCNIDMQAHGLVFPPFSGPPSQQLRKWLQVTLALFQVKADRHGVRMPWQAVVNRTTLPSDQKVEHPIVLSPRLILPVPKAWVEKSMSVFKHRFCELTGARDIIVSILYSEGPNWLRNHMPFLEECKKFKVSIPVTWFDWNWLYDTFEKDRADFWMRVLDQAAHKDVTPGVWSDVEEYLPIQALLPVDDTQAYIAWLKKEQEQFSAVLRLYEDQEGWVKDEKSVGYWERLIALKENRAAVFHAKLTHAGSGRCAGFRVFVQAIKTVDGACIDPMFQNYLDLDDQSTTHVGYRSAFEWLIDDQSVAAAHELFTGLHARRGAKPRSIFRLEDAPRGILGTMRLWQFLKDFTEAASDPSTVREGRSILELTSEYDWDELPRQ